MASGLIRLQKSNQYRQIPSSKRPRESQFYPAEIRSSFRMKGSFFGAQFLDKQSDLFNRFLIGYPPGKLPLDLFVEFEAFFTHDEAHHNRSPLGSHQLPLAKVSRRGLSALTKDATGRHRFAELLSLRAGEWSYTYLAHAGGPNSSGRPTGTRSLSPNCRMQEAAPCDSSNAKHAGIRSISENSLCESCGRYLGFMSAAMTMTALSGERRSVPSQRCSHL